MVSAPAPAALAEIFAVRRTGPPSWRFPSGVLRRPAGVFSPAQENRHGREDTRGKIQEAQCGLCQFNSTISVLRKEEMKVELCCEDDGNRLLVDAV